MTTNQVSSRLLAALAFASLFGTAALAGPPLVCWKVETGGAASLPWTESLRSYDGTNSDYDPSRLTADTLALLQPAAPVLARMETLRRASLYAMKSEPAGKELLSALVARTKADAANPLAWFDAGYYVEALRQAASAHEPSFWTRTLEALGIRETAPKSLAGDSGYDWVVKAIELRKSDPEMEYAAALISWHPHRPAHDAHLARAARGAEEGSPLAQNLLKHFADRGHTLAELRTIVRDVQ